MPPAYAPQPEIGGDLIRVHRALSRAVKVAYEYATLFNAEGFPDANIQKGYLIYVRCLVSLLHAHHVTEDKAMFPHLKDKLPNAPYDVLTAQHNAMGPIISDINDTLRNAKSTEPAHVIDKLRQAISRMDGLWREHIKVEEAHFGPDAIDAFLTMEERRRAARITANHSARHQFPLSLMVPFLLYNMAPEDRQVMFQLMPPFIPPLLVLWKPRWKIMEPFLLPDVP